MKIASAIMCFNRPHYFEKVMKSFEDAEEASDIDWYVFHDGQCNEISGFCYATDEELKGVSDIYESCTLPIKQIIKQPYNISPTQQRYQVLSLLKKAMRGTGRAAPPLIPSHSCAVH